MDFQTCFGGAVVKVKDTKLAEELRVFLHLYPIQSWQHFLRKMTKYLLLSLVLNQPAVMKPGISFFNVSGLMLNGSLIDHSVTRCFRLF